MLGCYLNGWATTTISRPTLPPPSPYAPGPVIQPSNTFNPIQAYEHYQVFFLQTTPLRWLPSTSSSQLPADALVLAQRDNYAVYACRADLFGGIHPGQWYRGKCLITYGGKVYPQQHYEVLTGANKMLAWRSDKIISAYFVNQHRLLTRNPKTTLPLIAGYEPERLLFICKVAYQGKVHIGKQVGKWCDIAIDENEIAVTDSRLLWVN